MEQGKYESALEELNVEFNNRDNHGFYGYAYFFVKKEETNTTRCWKRGSNLNDGEMNKEDSAVRDWRVIEHSVFSEWRRRLGRGRVSKRLIFCST